LQGEFVGTIDNDGQISEVAAETEQFVDNAE